MGPIPWAEIAASTMGPVPYVTSAVVTTAALLDTDTELLEPALGQRAGSTPGTAGADVC